MKRKPEPYLLNNNYRLIAKLLQEYEAIKATTIDAKRLPNLARHWGGFLIIEGKLFRNEFHPLQLFSSFSGGNNE